MFQRWECWWDNTFAYRVFKQHHTELNRLYWAHVPASSTALVESKKREKNKHPSEVFVISSENSRRLAPNLEKWENDYKDFSNWVRLNSAVALNSYLEVYLKRVCSLALESDPGLLIGVSRAVDGVKLLKSKEFYSQLEHVISVIKGTWDSRTNHYEQLFASVPQALKDFESELESLRSLRNGVGHTFGRNIDDYSDYSDCNIKPMQRLSEKRLLKWLKVVDDVALSIDNHLRNTYIGAYEMVLYYHKWDKVYDARVNSEHIALKEKIHTEYGRAPNKTYFKGLVEYYRML